MSDIHRKIAALLAKTTGNGCTEAEAMAAAEAAARLMHEHGLSRDDIEMVSATAAGATRRSTWRDRLATVIAHCTNTAAIVHPHHIEFFGATPGPEIAAYLRDICIRAVEREVKQFQASEFYRRRRTTKTRHHATTDFIRGMVDRLENRLWQAFGDVRDTDRLALAGAALERKYSGRFSDRKAPPAKQVRFERAADAGYMAGGNVPLNHGVDGGSAPSGLLT
ncbi:DUF7168 domain-containing protein [Camelimonas lactis]|uniref:Uncharacterized protein DUF2786 n=1 Tax=Camelimonas lactis TaxID=659006 RepID=A0A4R2GU12_9HYPH|nr:DUF2786 domain-containing protein [Camelimonas lactis]TCO12415.1 uncharacterized protein DUF2786 [Camelimonas lactis]